ncbi:histone-lysine N-methyltransferase SMYD3-like isoform X1 [Varroa destructor]|uniref:MYND-type domain-containing protein n=2 Tax=Varroa destructor TaxID=109461 RepID=A0A7M7JGQ9_VARDE|nr:histone-lysine N-methyltransferase SMYD3-like isoform X1 [Varroa destructor]XP_022651552.1 histone-lysine N-methyltransferase SMYD3-like isoform X1 [Varroa destructor]XP_022651553.1 histone-lysine N-methyltransferase SMYD3-like isoform X1 [Varroa destructor]
MRICKRDRVSRSNRDSLKRWTFRRGDEVVRAYPFASALQPQLAGKFCDECMQPLPKTITPASNRVHLRAHSQGAITIRCPNCPFVNYCSLKCQKIYSEYHDAVECAMLREFVPEVPDVTFRLFAKLLYKTHGREFSEFSENLFTGERRTFQDLLDHREDIKESPVVHTRFRTYLAFVLHTFPDNLKPDPDRALRVFGRMIINRFSVQSLYLEPIGEALYIGPSIHDHSCSPDAGFVFDGALLSIRAGRDLVVTDPRQIYICYIDILQTLEDRQSFLKEHYFFRCACPYCTDEQHLINRISAVKESIRDSLRGALTACVHGENESDAVQLDSVYQRARSLIEQDDSDEIALGKESTLKFWKIDALAVAFECAERLPHRRQTEAFKIGLRLLANFKLTYGECRPCVSVLCFRLAVIASEVLSKGNEQNEHELCQIIKDACTRLLATHGKDHPLTRRADCLAQQWPGSRSIIRSFVSHHTSNTTSTH